jgi:hypothetical protein
VLCLITEENKLFFDEYLKLHDLFALNVYPLSDPDTQTSCKLHPPIISQLGRVDKRSGYIVEGQQALASSSSSARVRYFSF